MSELVPHEVAAIYFTAVYLVVKLVMSQHGLLRHPEVLCQCVSSVFLRLQHYLHVLNLQRLCLKRIGYVMK